MHLKISKLKFLKGNENRCLKSKKFLLTESARSCRKSENASEIGVLKILQRNWKLMKELFIGRIFRISRYYSRERNNKEDRVSESVDNFITTAKNAF